LIGGNLFVADSTTWGNTTWNLLLVVLSIKVVPKVNTNKRSVSIDDVTTIASTDQLSVDEYSHAGGSVLTFGHSINHPLRRVYCNYTLPSLQTRTPSVVLSIQDFLPRHDVNRAPCRFRHPLTFLLLQPLGLPEATIEQSVGAVL
jgi:hypothetical protein